MTTNLFLTQSTRATYRNLRSRIEILKQIDSLYPITFLLPSTSVINDLRIHLRDTMRIFMYQFYNLANAILDEAGTPIQEINDIAVHRLILLLLHDMQSQGQLPTFEFIIRKPGFIEALIKWLREMKSQGIFPEEMLNYAQSQGNSQDHQLASIYMRYQKYLQTHNFSDTDGLLWLAAETLDKNKNLFQQNGAFFILGFDQFTPIQVQIINKLTNRFDETNIYLIWDEMRDQSSLALSRLNSTRDYLLEQIQMTSTVLPHQETTPNCLAHLHRKLFESNNRLQADENQIQLIEAPSRTDEVRYALREIKRLLLEGISANRIALLCPDKHTYLPIVRAVSNEFGIPVNYEQPLLQNPAISALINLLELPFEFPWQLTLQALRSPYLHQSWLSNDQINLLEQLSRESLVIAGREQWLSALQPITDILLDTDDDFISKRFASNTDPQILTDITTGLNAFFDHLTPPEIASTREYIWWLQTALIGLFPEAESDLEEVISPEQSLNILTACQQSPFAQRDLAALTLLMQTLRSLLTASDQIPSDEKIRWQDFRDQLINLLSTRNVPTDPLQISVLFDRLEAGRAQMVDYLFVLGLSEGEYPSPPTVDPFYTQQERQNHPLPLIRYNPADQASLWWQLIGNVNKKLTLLRPYLDGNGALWQASPYWEKVCDCFTGLQPLRIPIAEHPLPEDAASQTELMSALMHINAQVIPSQFQERYKQINYAKDIQEQRLSYLSAGEFEGTLRAKNIKTEITQQFGEQHIWSASRLNQYGNCPFRFFAQQILTIEALKDPEEGYDSLQRGSLLHFILEQVYRRLTKMEITPSLENQNKILDVLEDSCESIFPTAPKRFGFRPSSLWQYEQDEIKRLLRALILWDCEKNEKSNYAPFLQEASFGINTEDPPILEIKGNNTRFKLHGKIDRIDRALDGNLRIIDYKSGSTTFSIPNVKKGLALQTVLYALAVERYWLEKGTRINESYFLHIPTKKISGRIDFTKPVNKLIIEETLQRIFLHLDFIHQAFFPSKPADTRQCSHYCDYASFCRVTRQSIAKAKQGGLS